MEQDTEYIKLPLEERCVHKVICTSWYNLIFNLIKIFWIIFLTLILFIYSYGEHVCMDIKNV